jgi:hypothetical protein
MAYLADVIARCEGDEAIHPSACGAMDCFASLAMTALNLPILVGRK